MQKIASVLKKYREMELEDVKEQNLRTISYGVKSEMNGGSCSCGSCGGDCGHCGNCSHCGCKYSGINQ